MSTATPNELNPTRDDFAALLDESFAKEDLLEGTVVKGTILAIEKDMAIIDVGLKTEGRIAVREFNGPGRDPVKAGDIVEVFACGTAAVVTPIGLLKSRDFADEQPTGELALSLREELTDIQYGRRDDVHGWLTRLDAE